MDLAVLDTLDKVVHSSELLALSTLGKVRVALVILGTLSKVHVLDMQVSGILN